MLTFCRLFSFCFIFIQVVIYQNILLQVVLYYKSLVTARLSQPICLLKIGAEFGGGRSICSPTVCNMCGCGLDQDTFRILHYNPCLQVSLLKQLNNTLLHNFCVSHSIINVVTVQMLIMLFVCFEWCIYIYVCYSHRCIIVAELLNQLPKWRQPCWRHHPSKSNPRFSSPFRLRRRISAVESWPQPSWRS